LISDVAALLDQMGKTHLATTPCLLTPPDRDVQSHRVPPRGVLWFEDLSLESDARSSSSDSIFGTAADHF
jgi:hypothetical protein